MKQVFIFLLLWLSLVTQAQTPPNCDIQLQLRQIDMPDLWRFLPSGGGVLPLDVSLRFVLTGPSNTDGEIRITYPNNFTVLGGSSTPNTLNTAARQMSFPVTPGSSSATTGLSFAGSLQCSNCTNQSVSFFLEVIDVNGTVTCSRTFTQPVWNDNLAWGLQSVSSTVRSSGIVRGATVRYEVDLGQNNSCFASPTGTFKLIEVLPVGAYFVGAYTNSGGVLSQLPTSVNSSNNREIEITVNPSMSVVFVDVLYPCEFPTNTASNVMRYEHNTTTPCQTTRTVFVRDENNHALNSLTLNVTDAAAMTNANSAGTVTKRLINTGDVSPGELVGYEITFENTSSFPMNSLVLRDVFPSSLSARGLIFLNYSTVSAPIIHTLTGNSGIPGNNPLAVGTPVQIDNLGVGYTPPRGATNIENTTPITTGFRLSLPNGERLMPGGKITLGFSATLAANTIETSVTNTANANFTVLVPDCPPPISGGGGGGSGSGSEPPLTPTISVAGRASGSATFQVRGNNEPSIAVRNQGCVTDRCFRPGDTLTVYFNARNEGTGAIGPNGLTITHALPANATFVGGEAYYLIPASVGGVDVCRGQHLSYQITDRNQVSGSNAAGATTLVWQLGGGLLQSVGNATSDILIISYRVVLNSNPVSDGVANRGRFQNFVSTPAIIRNAAAGGNPASYHYNMCIRDELTVAKLVSTDGDTYSTQINAAPGSRVRYRLVLTNTGNMPLSNIRVADDMPHVGDRHLANIGGVPCVARNSGFEIGAAHPTPPTGNVLGYLQGHTPCLSTFFDYTNVNASSNLLDCRCGTTTPTAISASPSSTGFVLNLGNSVVLQPGATWVYDFEGIIPADAANGSTACNSITYRAERHQGTIVLEVGESNPTCVTIQTEDSTNAPCNCINPETGQPFQVDCPDGNCERCCKLQTGDCITVKGERRQSPTITGINVTSGVATINAVSNYRGMPLEYSIDGGNTWQNANTFNLTNANANGFIALVRYVDGQCEVSSEYKPTDINAPCDCINPYTGEAFQVDCPDGNCERCCKLQTGDCITVKGERRQSPTITGINVTSGVATINAVSNYRGMPLEYSIDGGNTWQNANTFNLTRTNSRGFIALVRYVDGQCEVSSEYKPTDINAPCDCINPYTGEAFQVDCPSGNCEECCKVQTPPPPPSEEGDCITVKGERRQSPTITGISVTSGVATINAVSNYRGMPLEYSIDGGNTWQNANTFNLTRTNSRGFIALVRYVDGQCEVSSEYKPINIGSGSPCNCINREGKPFQVDCPSGNCEECCKRQGGTVAGSTPTGEGDCVTVKGERRKSPTVSSVNLSSAQIVINATSNVPNMGLQYSLDGINWQNSNTFTANGRAGAFPIQNMTVYVRYADGQCQVSYYHQGMTNNDKIGDGKGTITTVSFTKKGETAPAYTIQVLLPVGMDFNKMFKDSEQAQDYTIQIDGTQTVEEAKKTLGKKNALPLAFPFFDANGDLLYWVTENGVVLSFATNLGAAYSIDAFMPTYQLFSKTVGINYHREKIHKRIRKNIGG